MWQVIISPLGLLCLMEKKYDTIFQNYHINAFKYLQQAIERQ